jgi:hypothetical protein
MDDEEAARFGRLVGAYVGKLVVLAGAVALAAFVSLGVVTFVCWFAPAGSEPGTTARAVFVVVGAVALSWPVFSTLRVGDGRGEE